MYDNFSQEDIHSLNEVETQGYEHLTVMLKKEPKDQGFGIAISGGKEGASARSGQTSIMVSDVLAESPADTLVKIGDVLIAINGINVENVKHGFAVETLRSLKKTVYLLLKRPKPSLENVTRGSTKLNIGMSPYSNNRYSGAVTDDDESNYPHHKNDHGTLEKSDTCKTKHYQLSDTCDDYNEMSFCLDKSKQGFGLYLGNVIYVKDKVPGTSGHRLDIRVGDIIKNINDIPIDTCKSTEDVLGLIKKSGKVLKLDILRPNVIWVPSSLAPKQEKIAHTATPHVKARKEHAQASYQVVNEKRGSDDQDPGNGIKSNSVGGSKFKEELFRNIRSRSTRQNDENIPVQKARSQSTNRFEAKQDSSVDEEPRYRERRSSRGLHINDGGDVKYYDNPRSLSMGSSFREPRTVKVVSNADQLGIQLIGGNKSGIFVSSLMENSPAAESGLRVGDQIIMVNSIDFRQITREDAVMTLLALKNQPILINCINKIASFERIKYQQGDDFYIRVNFNYLQPSNPRELVLRKGELLQVRDTMFGGTIGSWSAVRMSVQGDTGETGVIPNKQRAEQLAVKAKLEECRQTEVKRRPRPGRLSDKTTNTRVEYQSQDRLDHISFDEEAVSLPAYQKVTKKIVDFKRPVVLMGVACDVFRELLRSKYYSEFDFPTPKDNSLSSSSSKSGKQSPVKLFHIKKTISEGKHCLLDISAQGIQMLHHANLSPIVILLKLSERKLSTEFREAAIKMVYGRNGDPATKKEAKDMYRFGSKFNKKYPIYLNATLEILDQPVDQVSVELLNLIRSLQKNEIYISTDQVENGVIDSYVLREPSYAISGFTSATESGTEDDDRGMFQHEDDKVFRRNKSDSRIQSFNDKDNYSHVGSERSGREDRGRQINIHYDDDNIQQKKGNYNNLKSNITSYTGMKKSTPVTRIINPSMESKRIEFSLNTVLRMPADGNGGLIEAPSTKVSVYIPPGAFNDDQKVREIFFKVFLPKGKNQIDSELTPMVVCGPSGVKFSRPIEIRMPFDENTHEGIESTLKITPDFNADNSQWRSLSFNAPGSHANSFQLPNNITAILIEQF